jgi:hypothetical protein
METGYIQIIRKEGNVLSVEGRLVDNDLKMSKYEIAKLFHRFPQKVEANLRSIFKSRLLCKQNVSFTYRYTYKALKNRLFATILKC